MKRNCGGEIILGWFISNITKIEISDKKVTSVK